MANAFYRLRKVTAKTPQIIYVGFKYGFDQLVLSTGIKVLPQHWDFKKKEIKNVSKPNVILPSLLEKSLGENDLVSFTNNYLNDLKDFVNKNSLLEKDVLKIEIENYLNGRSEIDQFAFDLHHFVSGLIIKSRNKKKELSKEVLIQKIEDYLRPKTKLSLFEYIEKFIHEAETGYRLIDGVKRYAVRSIQRYRTTQKLLTDFQSIYLRTLDFETVDLTFYKDFSSYMATAKDYAPETMGKHITALKTFLREATEEGINQNLDYQKKTFKVASKSSEESVNIALNEDELLEMYQLDLSANQRLEKVRDLFIIGAETGLRFSDFTDIKPENIREDKQGAFIKINQFKTKREVVIPIDATVKTILQKYNNVLPTSPSNQKFNDYIKEVAQLCKSLQSIEFLSYVKGGKNIEESVERWKMISSHNARRSMATNAYERGTPVLSIMAITGHKTEKAFMAYIKTSKRKQAEIFRGYQK